MKKYNSFFIVAMLAISTIFVACDNDDDEVEPEIISPVAGEYIGTEICGQDTTNEIHILIYNTSFGENEVWVHNIADAGIDARGNVNGNTITIPEQDVALGANTFKVSGNANVNEQNITLNYVIKDQTGAVIADCTFTGEDD